MWRLGRTLARHGHCPRYAGYTARSESLAVIEARVDRRVAEVANAGREWALIGHSLGGLLLRGALARQSGLTPHLLVLLAAPNCPPRMARRSMRWAPFRWWTGEAGRSLASFEHFAELPVPTCPVLSIAGTRGWPASVGPFCGEPNDGVLAVSETHLGGEEPDLLVSASHTFIMNHRSAVAAILAALAG